MPYNFRRVHNSPNFDRDDNRKSYTYIYNSLWRSLCISDARMSLLQNIMMSVRIHAPSTGRVLLAVCINTHTQQKSYVDRWIWSVLVLSQRPAKRVNSIVVVCVPPLKFVAASRSGRAIAFIHATHQYACGRWNYDRARICNQMAIVYANIHMKTIFRPCRIYYKL